MEMRNAGIVGTGLYVPEEVRTNEWFKQFDLLPTDEFFQDSGVIERRVCAPNEKSSDMETKALFNAVKNAGISIEDVELILVGSTLQDQPTPGNATLVQHKAGAVNAAAINVESSCISLLSHIVVAWGLIKSGIYNTIACIGASNWTTVADYTEKNCLMLGDGAAAFIMQPVSKDRGILSAHMESDGKCWGTIGCKRKLPRAVSGNLAQVGSKTQKRVYFFIDRNNPMMEEVRRTGPIKTPEMARRALEKIGHSEKDIDFLITHNPTKPITEMWQKELKIPAEQTYTTIEKYGNMSAASIGANLHEAVALGKIKDGDLVVMCGPGGGMLYGAVVMRWGK